MPAPFRVAVIQAEPVYLDMMATIEESCRLSAEAAAGGAKLVPFPDRWAPEYPPWIWARQSTINYTHDTSAMPSQSNQKLWTVSKRPPKNIPFAVVFDFAEQSPTHSLYISQAIISPPGRSPRAPTQDQVNSYGAHHFWRRSGNDFDNVAETYFGPDHSMVKVGCLASWEHTQPLRKYHTISQDETIHVAMWPSVSPRVANEMGRSHPILWDWTVGWAKIASFSRGTSQNDPPSCLTSHKTKGILLSLFLATKKW